ncbi:amidohydrolase family protein [Mesorhizobium sp. ArgA1]
MNETEVSGWIGEQVKHTVLADTHEHLVEESRRTSPHFDGILPCDDWSLLFKNYLQDDLSCAGMTTAESQRFYDPDTPAQTKFTIVRPYWATVQHTGYARALSLTLRELYGIDAFSPHNVEQLSARYQEMRRPGFYAHILKDVCRLSQCHVNSLEKVYMETEQPQLLQNDISIMELSRCSLTDIRKVQQELDVEIGNLTEWLAAIDQYFERFGRQAVSVKYVGAYYRRLNFGHVSRHAAERFFATMISDRPFIGTDGYQALEDYLVHYCLGKAQEYGLPVKIHTGYQAGSDFMPLAQVHKNASDICKLLQAYPGIRFVLMHIGYPYQDEYLALCKHYKNAYVDMCWAWIINPQACVRFLAEFLVSVPCHKVLTFGGDYSIVENIVGHSVIARQGITAALAQVVGHGWIDRGGVLDLIRRLMHGNAEELFPNARNT